MIFNRNMFYRLLSTIMFFCCANVFAQTVHVVTVGSFHGFDERGRTVIAKDVQNFTLFLQKHISEKHLKLYNVDGMQATPENIIKQINEVNPAPNDTMVFYYSGHAANDPQVAGAYFQLADNKGKNTSLPRVEVKNAMLKKGAHLNILFTDCCNVFDASKSLVTKAASDTTLPPEGFTPIAECLFVKPTGVVDITTSRFGQYSYTAKGGSVGTVALLDTLDDIGNKIENKKAGDQTWLSIKPAFLYKSHNLFKKIYPNGAPPAGQLTQTPHFYETPAVRFGVRVISLMQGNLQVTEVLPDSPGSRAGIKVGDVITHINNKEVLTEYDYSDAIDRSPIDMELRIQGKSESIHAKLLENVEIAPIDDVNVEVVGTGTATPVAGTQAVPGTTNAQNFKNHVPGVPVFGVTLDFTNEKGLITNVVIGSPADICHLEKGDRIVQVNQTIINTPSDFNNAVDSAPALTKLVIVDQKTGEHKDMIINLNK